MEDMPLFAYAKKQDERYRLVRGECVEAMRSMPAESVDSVVCDPPYGISFMQADFDSLGDGPAQQEWHKAWAIEALRILKPGGHLLAFGSPKSYHRLASAIEDAGFEIRDSIFWCFGSGMTKSKHHLKPAYEPIVIGRKATRGTAKANIALHGTGALNPSLCLVPFTSEADERESKDKNRHADFDSQPSNHGIYSPDNRTGVQKGNYNPPGRWPANVVLSHDERCFFHNDSSDWACVSSCPVRIMDAQSGISKSSGGAGEKSRGGMGKHIYGKYDLTHNGANAGGIGDIGGASRYFMRFEAEPFVYSPKANKKERSEGLENRNSHICVKPVAVMAYLCRLVTPVGGIIIDPFMGSGSTGVAALREGFRFIGIEREAEYFAIAEARLDHAAKMKA